MKDIPEDFKPHVIDVVFTEIDERDLPQIEQVIRRLRKQKRADLDDLLYSGMVLLSIAKRNGLPIS
jgi:hypothetical protein